MPTETLSMRQIRQVLQLHCGARASARVIVIRPDNHCRRRFDVIASNLGDRNRYRHSPQHERQSIEHGVTDHDLNGA